MRVRRRTYRVSFSICFSRRATLLSLAKEIEKVSRPLRRYERFRARVRRIRKDAGGQPDTVVIGGWNSGNAASGTDRPGLGIVRPWDT